MASLVIDKQRVKDNVETILIATGRDVTIEEITMYDVCPTCGGNDPFCPTCNGNDVVSVVQRTTVAGKIEWKNASKKRYYPGWQEIEGDARVTIMNNDDWYTRLNDVKYVEVDGYRCALSKFRLGGLDGNRIYLTLNQDSRVDGIPRIG